MREREKNEQRDKEKEREIEQNVMSDTHMQDRQASSPFLLFFKF